MLVPAIFPLLYAEDDLWSFVVSALITSTLGFALEKLTKPSDTVNEIERKDGFLIASFAWIGASVFGASPFMLYGALTNPADAFLNRWRDLPQQVQA